MSTLISLCHYKQSVTLIENSGIQFMDFGLETVSAPFGGRFVRKTANGPLLRLNYDDEAQRYTLCAAEGMAEVVKPEYTFSLEQSLQVLDSVWLPLPLLRFHPPHTFSDAPDNWARVQIRRLPAPDESGHRYRVTLAVDTRLMPDSQSERGPCQQDVHNGSRFRLAWRNDDVSHFLDQTWVDGWLREAFTHYALQHEGRSEAELARALRSFEYQGHWLNLMEVLGTQLTVSEVCLISADPASSCVDVDLVLDIGNTHTCGVLIEDHGEFNHHLRHTAALQLRDLSRPQYASASLFSSRAEFSAAEFGKPHFSLQSGRENAFAWPSLVRVGDEAVRLAHQRQGSEGWGGLSSPRRYLWDESPATQPWHFTPSGPEQPEAPAVAWPLASLMNDDGVPLFRLPAAERMPVFAAHYSRSSLMMHMVCELLAQALSQINSVANRQQMGLVNEPRRLRSLILTLPCAMPKPEREIFRRRIQDAVVLVWKSLGWHAPDAEVDSWQAANGIPMPEIDMSWDEASCGQLVWLYNEISIRYGGQVKAFFTDYAAAEITTGIPGRSLRVASLDIGGGTSDIAITCYRLEGGQKSGAKMSPELLFREGFNVAGDDILLDVIQLAVLPAISAALQEAGAADVPGLMTALFGDSGKGERGDSLRQQATLQLLIPTGYAVLQAWEQSHPGERNAGLRASFGQLVTHPLTDGVQCYLRQTIQAGLPAGAPALDIMQVALEVNFAMLNEALTAGRFRITRALQSLCEAISHYACDVLLITGRPTRLPGIKQLLRQLQPVPAGRFVWLDGYQVNEWYPFSEKGRIANPKSTAAVGAVLCRLALDLRLSGFHFKAANIGAYSTLRFFGELSGGENRLEEENVWYREIDLDDPGAQLDMQLHFPLRGSVTLGFRQLENARWPASPLYTLTVNSPQLARTLAGDGVLNVRLQLCRGPHGPEAFALHDAWLQNGERVALKDLTLKMNTLSDRRFNAGHYWIDSGSVYLK